jgi:MFS family permease
VNQNGTEVGMLFSPSGRSPLFRRVFLLGIALFTVASTACGLASGQGGLIAARAVQGLGGAVGSTVSYAPVGAVWASCWEAMTVTLALMLAVMVITNWDTLGAIHAFAGLDAEVAVVPPVVVGMMHEYDSRARHYEVLA